MMIIILAGSICRGRSPGSVGRWQVKSLAAWLRGSCAAMAREGQPDTKSSSLGGSRAGAVTSCDPHRYSDLLAASGRVFRLFSRELNYYGVVVVIGGGVVIIVVVPVPEAAALRAKKLVA